LVRIVEAVEEIAGIWREFGLTACVHNHVGSYIETEDELDRVMRASSAALCPDTGHLAWAAADPLQVTSRYQARVRMLHLKDLSDDVLSTASTCGWDYDTTVQRGLWREPGHGDLDLVPVIEVVRDFAAWMIIEVDHSIVSPAESARRCATWAHARA
jgi:inosose dehydratase